MPVGLVLAVAPPVTEILLTSGPSTVAISLPFAILIAQGTVGFPGQASGVGFVEV